MMRHRAIPLVVSALLLPCLVALGFWQLDRSSHKQAIRDLVVERSAQSPQPLDVQSVNASALQWRTVQLTGHWDTGHEVLIDNKVLKGRPGYHVVTPLVIHPEHPRVLVNRGWVAWGDDRTTLPATPAPIGEHSVTGRVVVPTTEFLQLVSDADSETWARLWQNLDLERYRRLSPFAVAPLVVELDPESAAGGFERVWRDHDDGWIARHHGYAMQWFGLAATLIIINLVVWRRRRQTHGDDEGTN